MSVKKLALLFSHPEVTLWARLLPWGHFVIFHSGTGSPADTLSQDWENLPKLKATGGPPQSTSAHTEPPQCLCLVPDAGLCVPSTAPGCGHCVCPVGSCCYVARAWGCKAIAPTYSQTWDLPLPAQGCPKHVWEVSWVCERCNRRKAGAQRYCLWCLWSKNRIQKIQLDVCPLPREQLTCFCTPSLCIWPSIPMSDATTSRTSTPENQPPSEDLGTLHFTLVRKSIFIDCQSCLKEKGENIIKPGSTVSSSEKRS